MKDIIEYDITSCRTLFIGNEEDNNARIIRFANYVMKNEKNTVYLKIEFKQPVLILLTDMSFAIKQPITLNHGMFNAQIVEFGSDDELVRNSNIFDVYISPSIKNAKEYELRDSIIDLEYVKLRDLYNTVVQKLENGEFIGEKGHDAYEVAVESGFEGTREQCLIASNIFTAKNLSCLRNLSTMTLKNQRSLFMNSKTQCRKQTKSLMIRSIT